MTTLQIRNVPGEIYEVLRLRARRENRSLTQQAIVELRRMPELDGREHRQRMVEEIAEEIRRTGGRKLVPPPEDLIREDRDR